MSNISALVCICIPVYNGAKTIGLTLDSILSQSYSNFEIIVCDNMSTDNTVEIVSSYIGASSIKVSILINPNKGTGEANWNFMLRNIVTQASFIAIYHADDIYDKHIVSEQVKFMQAHNLMASFTLCKLIDENGLDITATRKYVSTLPKQIKSSVFTYDQLLKYILRFRNFIITPTFLFRKELLSSFDPFFDNSIGKSSSDLDTWLRISKLHKIGIVQQPLLNYRISSTQGSFLINSGRTQIADFFSVVDAHIAQLDDVNLYKQELKYYQVLKANDLIICAVNLLKKQQFVEAKQLVVQANSLYNSTVWTKVKHLKLCLFSFVILLLLNCNMKNSCNFIAGKITL